MGFTVRSITHCEQGPPRIHISILKGLTGLFSQFLVQDFPKI